MENLMEVANFDMLMARLTVGRSQTANGMELVNLSLKMATLIQETLWLVLLKGVE